MPFPISLNDFVKEMDAASQDNPVYLEKATGAFFDLTEEDFVEAKGIESDDELADYPDWQQDVLRAARKILAAAEDEFLRLPGKPEVNEYALMQAFAEGYGKAPVRAALLNSLRGSGAFRRFRETARRFKAEADWFQFKERAYQEIAIAWLERYHLSYVDDRG